MEGIPPNVAVVKAARDQGQGWSRTVADRMAKRARFEELVRRALDELPEAAARALSNVEVVISERGPRDLLGLYEGIPLTERDSNYAGVLPDVITLFREAIEAKARDSDDLVKEVRTTVLHEIAHHFGISDDRLHELGWG